MVHHCQPLQVSLGLSDFQVSRTPGRVEAYFIPRWSPRPAPRQLTMPRWTLAAWVLQHEAQDAW